MKKEIIRINNLSYKVKDGDEEKMCRSITSMLM